MTGEELGLYSMLFCQLVELDVGATQSGISRHFGTLVLSQGAVEFIVAIGVVV